MKTLDFLKKVDALYTKVTIAIIGDIPSDAPSTASNSVTIPSPQNKLHKLKTLVEKGLTKIQKDGIKKSILTMGEPQSQDNLYEEVVKREKKEEKERQKKKEVALKVAKVLKKERKAISKESTKVEKTKKDSTSKVIHKKSIKKTASSKIVKDTPIKPITDNKKIQVKQASKGGKRVAKIALYIKDIKKHYGTVDEKFVAIIVKNLGPSIYKKDAEFISCSHPKELVTVRKNFLIKKLGIDASQGVLDAAISDVCEELKEAKKIYRATFYYSLAKKFKKESVLN